MQYRTASGSRAGETVEQRASTLPPGSGLSRVPTTLGAMSILLALLTLGAIWRLARLVTVDEIFSPVRERIGKINDSMAYLITCPWCFSIWLGIPLSAVVIYFPDNRGVWLVLLGLTGSGIAGMMQVIEDRLDR